MIPFAFGVFSSSEMFYLPTSVSIYMLGYTHLKTRGEAEFKA